MNDPRDQYTDEQLRDIIERAVTQHSSRRRHPHFYAITGSHIYGFPSESSDIDIRGFHTAPAQEYALLNSPQKEITVNMDGLTDGFEDHPDIDLRSYELRHFGEHLAKANFNIMELVFEADIIMNGVVLEMDALRGFIRKHLPLDVPH